MSSSESNVWKSLFDQFAEAMDLVREGKRDPEWISRILQAIIYNDYIHTGDYHFTIRETITVGDSASVDELLKMVASKNIWNFGEGGSEKFHNLFREVFSIAEEERDVRIVAPRVDYLGFPGGGSRDKVIKRALSLDCDLHRVSIEGTLKFALSEFPGPRNWVYAGSHQVISKTITWDSPSNLKISAGCGKTQLILGMEEYLRPETKLILEKRL